MGLNTGVKASAHTAANTSTGSNLQHTEPPSLRINE